MVAAGGGFHYNHRKFGAKPWSCRSNSCSLQQQRQQLSSSAAEATAALFSSRGNSCPLQQQRQQLSSSAHEGLPDRQRGGKRPRKNLSPIPSSVQQGPNGGAPTAVTMCPRVNIHLYQKSNIWFNCPFKYIPGEGGFEFLPPQPPSSKSM